MADKSSRITLVTGANRGIGFEVCRQLASRSFVVLLTARDAAKARTAARKLGNVGTVEPLLLDVADAHSIQKAAPEVASRYGYLDVVARRNVIRRELHRFFSRPSENFEPAFDQGPLWIRHVPLT